MTFLEVLDSMDQETPSVKAIKHGLNIREDFWDDFMRLLNADEEVSELLKIPVEKIHSWSKIIKENLKKTSKSKRKHRAVMLHTGDL